MKPFSKLILLLCTVALVITACNKEGNLPFYKSGSDIALTSSTTTLTPSPSDSANTAVSFSWSSPQYAIDSSTTKYVLQIDTSGGNFVTAINKQVTGSVSTSFTATEMNNILVNNFGYAFNTSRGVDVRVLASYPNNNDQKISNTVTVQATPYAIPFALTASTTGPVVISLQNKSETVETFNWHAPNYGGATLTYTLQYDTAGNNFAAAKTINTATDTTTSITGDDLNKYATASGIQADKTGTLEFRIASTINGKQIAYSNVQSIAVTPTVLIAYLYVPGDYQGWNPSSAPALASSDGSAFDGYVNITSLNGFKFTSEPDWDHTNYGDAGSGKLSTSGGNLNVPSAGFYRLQANTADLTWSATATTWGIIGAATPKGWDASTELSFDATTNTWTIASIALTADDFKFRANDAWDINLGGDPSKLSYGGDNLHVSEAGNYKVVLDLSHAPNYTYTLTKL